MAIKAINNLAPDWYTPESQVGETNPFRARLKSLDSGEYMEIMLEVDKNVNGVMAVTGKGLRLAIKYGLIGWENFTDDSGDVPFSRAAVGRLPVNELSDIASAVLERSKVSEEQEKN